LPEPSWDFGVTPLSARKAIWDLAAGGYLSPRRGCRRTGRREPHPKHEAGFAAPAPAFGKLDAGSVEVSAPTPTSRRAHYASLSFLHGRGFCFGFQRAAWTETVWGSVGLSRYLPTNSPKSLKWETMRTRATSYHAGAAPSLASQQL